jgi:hypothetical protein
MKTKWKAALAGLALVTLSGAAAARDQVNFTLSIGTPAPVVYAAPAYYPHAVYVPQRVYYPAVATETYVVRHYDRYGVRHGQWRGPHRYHRHYGWR